MTEGFPCFLGSFKQIAVYKSPKRGTARTIPNFCVVLCIACFVPFCVLFLCKCVLYCTELYCTVLYYCHRMTTQLHLTNISYNISERGSTGFTRLSRDPLHWKGKNTSFKGDRDSAVGIATHYGLDGPEVESRRRRDFRHAFRPFLGPTQLPVQ